MNLTVKRKARILVVDDDPQAVEMLAHGVEGLASVVLRAYGGKEAIDLARKDEAAAEAATRHAAAINTGHVARQGNQRVQLRAAHFIIIAQGLMAAIHRHARTRPVARLQRGHEVLRPLILGDDMPCSAQLEVWQGPGPRLPHLP